MLPESLGHDFVQLSQEAISDVSTDPVSQSYQIVS